MKRFTLVSGICASFVLGMGITAVAQGQDEHRNDKNDKQEQARPEERQKQEPQSGDRKNTTPQSEGRQSQEPQSGDRHPESRGNDRQMQERQQQQQEDREQQGRKQQPRPEEKPGREVNGGRQDQARPEGQARGAEPGRREGNQRRIPDSDFHAHFGHEHHFAPGRVQVYGGRPQFTYSGFVFALVEPWPADWAYDDDDYYIDYVDDEYWLYSLRYPGVRLELIIVD
jgi:hypothetical protein